MIGATVILRNCCWVPKANHNNHAGFMSVKRVLVGRTCWTLLREYRSTPTATPNLSILVYSAAINRWLRDSCSTLQIEIYLCDNKQEVILYQCWPSCAIHLKQRAKLKSGKYKRKLKMNTKNPSNWVPPITNIEENKSCHRFYYNLEFVPATCQTHHSSHQCEHEEE